MIRNFTKNASRVSFRPWNGFAKLVVNDFENHAVWKARETRHSDLRTQSIRPSSTLTLVAGSKPFRALYRKSSTMATTRSTDPLVWIDCEMTGLDPTNDQILSISCYITTHDLTFLDDKGYHAVVSTPKSILDAMGEWCQKTHTATGLVDACQSPSAIIAPQASNELLTYIKQHVPQARIALLAGNSVHADKMFLMKQPWSPILEHLHYRILDVSAIKEAVRRWGSEDVLRGVPRKKLTHNADDDIKESIEEARYYMSLFNQMGSSGNDKAPGSNARPAKTDWGAMD